MDSLLWNRRSDVFSELRREINPAPPFASDLAEEFWEEKFKRVVRKFGDLRKGDGGSGFKDLDFLGWRWGLARNETAEWYHKSNTNQTEASAKNLVFKVISYYYLVWRTSLIIYQNPHPWLKKDYQGK